MAWRPLEGDRSKIPGPARKPFMKELVMGGTPVGLLGYDAGEPVAWVSVAPKATYERLGGPKPQAGENVWSLACMFMRRSHRGQGLAHQLIAAAAAHARKNGGTVLEAYPVDPDSPSYRFMGFVGAYHAAGFTEVAKAGTRRHVMRLAL